MSTAALVYLVLTLTIVLLLNLAALRFWRTLHPKTFRYFAGLAVFGNLFWLYVPFILRDRLSSLGRILRATLGPFWFAWLGLLLVYVSVMMLVLLAWRLSGRRRAFTAFGRPVSAALTVMILVISVIGFYGAIVPLRVEQIPIVIEGLPPGLSGFRIGLMSDLHVGLFTRRGRLQRFASELNAERPDIVLLSGDLIDDDPFFVGKLLSGIERIDVAIPVFGVLGNHEIYGDPHQFIDRLKGSRVELLVNRGVPIRRGASSMWLAGISDYAAGARQFPELVPDLDAALQGRETGMTTIVLSHQPKVFDQAITRTIPLTLCGHTHGGQMGIRALNWSLAGVFLPYHMGLYRRGASQLYVNTGTGFWLVPFRFGMTPEITIIELVAG